MRGREGKGGVKGGRKLEGKEMKEREKTWIYLSRNEGGGGTENKKNVD